MISDNNVKKEKTSAEKLESKVTEKKKFIPGGIHLPDSRKFWKTELNPDRWVLDVLEFGYILPFVKLPPVYKKLGFDVK